MTWTVADYVNSNHNPIAEVNGHAGTAPIFIDAEVGKPVVLDAGGSRNPDGQRLHFSWFHYSEAGSASGPLAGVALSVADTAKAVVTPTAACRPLGSGVAPPCPGTGTAHIILAVTDDGSPPLTSYRRIILTVHQIARHPY